MSTKIVSRESVSKLLGQWYNALVRHELDEAEKRKADVENTIMDMEEDQTILLYYSLLVLRHDLLSRQGDPPNQYLSSMKPFKEEMGPLLTYYYHLFTGMYEVSEGHYGEALEHYTAAEEKLNEIPDDMEKGEFHYRVASVYYYIRQTLLAFKHVKQAKAIFDTDKDYGKKSADCENLLGLCYISNKDFQLAEKHINHALETAEQLEDEELKLYVHYNLGYLYAEKGDSQRAIVHLTKVYKEGFYAARTPLLLAEEYYKLSENDIAFNMVETGLKACEARNDVEYQHHYHILRAFHNGSGDEQVEAAVKEGIAYFKKHSHQGSVDDYYNRLAQYFNEKKNHEKASHYFQMAYDYRKEQKILLQRIESEMK